MEKSVLCRLNAAAEKYSTKTAFKDPENSLTFGEFNGLTKSIGTYLAGITQPGDPVVVMSGRHVYTPACFLGAVRAGCFYAPMDGDMPVTRLNQIIGVIKAKIMVVDKAHLEIAQSLNYDGEIFVMEDILDTPVDEAVLAEREKTLVITSPLYVIFTSGSTGVPKGVITSHLSLMTYIDSVSKVLDINDADVMGNQSPLDYIAAVRDIYFPISKGASTYIIPKNEFAVPTALFETLNREKITALCWSVAGMELPARLHAFDYVKPEHLKTVLFSGSVMPCKYLRLWQDALPGVRFINQYGPTETTASCTYYEVEGLVDETTMLPIGVPYDNYTVFLLSPEGKAVPDGELGEICVSGPSLALGYYRDPERTAQSFIQNPLNDRYFERIYKTGDIGRVREDGLLEFHGRNDRQIKHQGHRVELGELEVTAMNLEGVHECCAMYKNEKISLVFAGEAKEKEVQLAFRERLPLFMMPRKVVKVKALPRLPNGKLDMQAINLLL